MSLTMLKNNHGSKCYLELSSKAFSKCGQNLCKSCHSTPFRCSILSVEFNIKVHCRQLQIIGVANTCFRPIFNSQLNVLKRFYTDLSTKTNLMNYASIQ